ncbi:MAG: PIN domain-containing protein [Nitrospirae bacterium CG08_land_8_20_14_0_20_52_24]|nr:MAG: PIN domain-containing protein [Nitrospirae bacterium CG08_land_8_20_14_0_20_52_24]
MIRVYFDSCVYNRPFDDYQKSERIFIEAMAFYVLLHRVESGQIGLIHSDALLYEHEQIADAERKRRVKSYLEKAVDFVSLSDSVMKRAKEVEGYGFKGLDALHIAMAEHGKAGYFVTCDDGIVRKGKALQKKIGVRIYGILEFLMEAIYAENIE